MEIERNGTKIELTYAEIEAAYRLQKRNYMKEDIASKVEERIEDLGLGDEFADDWAYRVAEETADTAQSAVDNNDLHNECYWSSVDMAINDVLKRNGFNPETLKKEEGER